MSEPLKAENGTLTESGVAHVNALIAQLGDIEAILYTATFHDRPNGSLRLDPSQSKVFFDPSGAVRRGFAQAAIDTRAALLNLGVTAREIPWVSGWLDQAALSPQAHS